MRADLKMLNGNSYAIALSVFFVSYVAVEIPALVLLKRFGLRRSIPAMMIAWSTVMVLMGVVHNAAGLTAARFFLGLAEGPREFLARQSKPASLTPSGLSQSSLCSTMA